MTRLVSSHFLLLVPSTAHTNTQHYVFIWKKMAEKSKILFVGGTGYIGKFIVEASAKSGHPTFLLIREATLSNPSKSQLIDSFKGLGVTFLHVRKISGSLWFKLSSVNSYTCACCVQGDLYDHGSLVKAIKQVDVVISTLGHQQLADQDKLLAAIKECGNVKVLCSICSSIIYARQVGF